MENSLLLPAEKRGLTSQGFLDFRSFVASVFECQLFCSLTMACHQ